MKSSLLMYFPVEKEINHLYYTTYPFEKKHLGAYIRELFLN